MTNQSELKARLIRRAESRKSYASHGRAAAYNLPSHGWNPPAKDGSRWAESLEGCGLRLAGFADEIVRLDHKGWYADTFEDSTFRGVVLQFPARGGCARYVAAYADPNNEGTYCVDFSAGIFVGESGEDVPDSRVARDAARAADSFAEKRAEESRNYDEAWQLGSRYAALGEEAKQARTDARALALEMKAARDAATVATPSICGTLRATLAGLRRQVREALEKRRAMLEVNSWWESRYGSAFNEGAGCEVFKVRA